MPGGRHSGSSFRRGSTYKIVDPHIKTVMQSEFDLPVSPPSSPRGATQAPPPTRRLPTPDALPVTAWVREVAEELRMGLQQTAWLTHLYFDVLKGIGGRNALWHIAREQPRRLELDEPKGQGWGKATNPRYSTQKQVYVFHGAMKPSQDLNQLAFRRPRASKKLPSAQGPHRIFQFDAGTLNAVRNYGFSHIFVVVDTWSRYIRAFKIKTIKSKNSDSTRAKTAVKGSHVAAALQEVFDELIEDFGDGTNFPHAGLFMSDGGPENENSDVRELIALYNSNSSKRIKHQLTKAHTPTQNAFAENAIKLVKGGISQFRQAQGKNWAVEFDTIVAILNKRRHRVLGVAPFEADQLDSRVPADRAQIAAINKRILGEGVKRRKPYQKKESVLEPGATVLIKNPEAVKTTLRQKFETLWKEEIHTVVSKTRRANPADPVKYKIRNAADRVLPFTWAREDLLPIDPARRFAPPPTAVQEVEYAFHVVDHRDNPGGTRSYRVRYDGYRQNEDRWLPSRQVSAELASDYFKRIGDF